MEADEVLQATLVRLQHLCQLEAVLEQCLEVAKTPLPTFPSLRAGLNLGPAAVSLTKVCSGSAAQLACFSTCLHDQHALPPIPAHSTAQTRSCIRTI